MWGGVVDCFVRLRPWQQRGAPFVIVVAGVLEDDTQLEVASHVADGEEVIALVDAGKCILVDEELDVPSPRALFSGDPRHLAGGMARCVGMMRSGQPCRDCRRNESRRSSPW